MSKIAAVRLFLFKSSLYKPMQAALYPNRILKTLKQHLRLFLLCGLTICVCRLAAQGAKTTKITSSSEASISNLINRIENQQIKEDPTFIAGSYPSFIHHRRHFKQKHKDITIFYNILVDMTLKGLRSELPNNLQSKIDTLLARSSKIYPRFYNAKRGSYNFWLRDSSYRFPYSWWIPLIKKDGAVPDDMDDTVLSTFVSAKPSKDSLKLLHQRMQDYTLRVGQKHRTTPKPYRHFYTYSTWFGEKFPVVLDAAVLSNILSFVNHYDLPWTQADSAALRFIVKTIKSKDYINAPLKISPYYGRTAILLYHYSRLMQQKSLPVLDSLRPQLISEAKDLIFRTDYTLEKVIAANALIQFGEKAPQFPLPEPGSKAWKQQIEHSDYPYFIGNIPSYMSRGLQGILSTVNAMMYYHYCPAFNNALALQYLVYSSAH